VRRVLLTQVGYDVLIASDPTSALAIADKVNLDLVILDYSFPGNMSGEELARILRARKPALPLMMLSGFSDLPDSATENVDVLLLKGTGQPTELLNSISTLLGSVRSKPVIGERNEQVMEKSRELPDDSKNQQILRDEG